METVKALVPNGKIKNGCTRPYYITCDDGFPYAVKFKENPEGLRVLANEYVCAKLAEILELPLASPRLIQVDTTFVQDYGPEISDHIEDSITPGVHFGTKKVKKAFQISNTQMLEKALNVECIPEVILFDQIICNRDRDSNGGNLIFDATKMEIVVIDHTHAFDLGPIWQSTDLKQRIGNPFELMDPTGYVYSKLVPFIRGNNPFNNIMGKLPRLNSSVIRDIINSIPDEWEVNEEEKKVLHEYLLDRISRIEEVFPIIKPHLPFWKGGV